MTDRLILGLLVLLLGNVWSFAQEPEPPLTGQAPEPSPPLDVTEKTRKDEKALARLERPGKILFEDGFESDDSYANWFEIRGREDERAKILRDRKLAHSGRGLIRFRAPENGGKESGSGASAWLGAAGHERIYFRRYIRFAADYDQGNLNHTGGGLAGVATDGKWDGMGSAGKRPRGDDRFSCGFEPWRAWGREESPGYLFLYTYWMDMKRDRDGNYWGNMLQPDEKRRIVPPRDRWVCLEQMIGVNEVGKADGEVAAWIDGELYLHMTGIRWRTSEKLKVKRFDIGIYIHRATRDNIVYYDDVAVSTGYIGPKKADSKSKR